MRPPWIAIGRVAQLVRAPASHAGGHRFESCRAHHYFQLLAAISYANAALDVDESVDGLPAGDRFSILRLALDKRNITSQNELFRRTKRFGGESSNMCTPMRRVDLRHPVVLREVALSGKVSGCVPRRKPYVNEQERRQGGMGSR
jgi:hypothetical protein